MNEFKFAAFHVQQRGFELTATMLIILALEDEQMTHRERRHFNTVLKAITMELNKLLQPASEEVVNIPF